MVNYSVRSGLNWFDRRVLARRSAKSIGRQNSVATAQEERRRFITLGLRMTFASLAAQPNRRWGCRLRVENFGSAAVAAALYRCQPRARQGLTVYVPHVLPKARGLGVTVRRRQCKDCRRFRCLCVFWRFAPAGDCPPGQSSLHPIPLFPKVIRIDSTFDVLEEIAACSNDRPFTTAARLNR
jgi:hypothetical protein